jgi:hypothetical protein
VVLADGLGKEQGHGTTRRVHGHDSGLFLGKQFHQASPSEHRYLEQNVKSKQLFNQAGFHSLGTTQPRHRCASAQLASSNDFTRHPRRRRQQQAQARPCLLSGLCGPFRHQLVSLSLGWRPRRRLHPRRLRLLLRRLPAQPRTLHLPRRPEAWSAWPSSLALWSGWLVGALGLG